ncbi:hypothetical protein [Rubrivirga sp. IMCC45206]|uniref:hypothetical protein n=1 Tax=Rubrivirga sp. IMCC45206 TaxID=3391614 RepID=UPI00398FC2A8
MALHPLSRTALGAVLAVGLAAALVACDAQAPQAVADATPTTESSQRAVVFDQDAAPFTASPADAPLAASTDPIRVAAIGGNFGYRAADDVFANGDLVGSVDRLTAVQFNAMTVADLRAAYDVLLFTWNSPTAVDADWATRLAPYLALGGGVLWEDDENVGDLAPAVTAVQNHGSGTLTITPVPGLTDGITGVFANYHIRFDAWAPAFSPLMTIGGTTRGLYADDTSTGGRIVLTGPDQDFHAHDGDNAYAFLVNALMWVSSGVADSDGDGVPDDEDPFPNSDLGPTVVVDGDDTGVGNHLFPTGATFNDLLGQCAADAATHGEFVSCVSHLTNEWKAAGLISGREKGRIVRAAARSDVPA